MNRVDKDYRLGRLFDSEIVFDFKILVDRLLNYDRQVGPTGFSTGKSWN